MKKRPENSLILPKVSSQKHLPIVVKDFPENPGMQNLSNKIEKAYHDYGKYLEQHRIDGTHSSFTKPSSAKPLLTECDYIERVYSKLELDRLNNMKMKQNQLAKTGFPMSHSVSGGRLAHTSHPALTRGSVSMSKKKSNRHYNTQS